MAIEVPAPVITLSVVRVPTAEIDGCNPQAEIELDHARYGLKMLCEVAAGIDRPVAGSVAIAATIELDDVDGVERLDSGLMEPTGSVVEVPESRSLGTSPLPRTYVERETVRIAHVDGFDAAAQ